MIVIRRVSRVRGLRGGCAATVGKFDGVHLGHQSVLEQLQGAAGEVGLPAVVIVLEPHPEEFFAGAEGADGNCPARLSSLEEKLRLLEGCGVDVAFVLGFDEAMSRLSAEDYIKDILVDGLGLRRLIIGGDFRFGHGRRGDVAMLRRYGERCGFTVAEAAAYEQDGKRVSSTLVRESLAAGDFALAEKLLRRPYSIRGEVVRGRRLGTELGFPTCNIRLQRRRIPLHGIYAAEVKLGERVLPAAVSMGYRPTLSDDGEALLEAHILDFDGDLYGQCIEVLFRRKIRDEVKFNDIESMKQQIAADVEKMREVL